MLEFQLTDWKLYHQEFVRQYKKDTTIEIHIDQLLLRHSGYKLCAS